MQVFVGDPRSSEFVDHERYGRELNVNPFEPHEFTDEDDKSATEWQQISGRKLTKMCRAGVPEHFRGGVWNKVMSPTMEEGGTPSHKLQRERIWTRVLEKVFEGGGIGEEVPGYGAELRLEDHCLSADGRAAARRLLVTIKHMQAAEWCPTLLDVVPMFLVYMPESCAYGVVEDLWPLRSLFFPHSRSESDAWNGTFMDIVKDLFPETSVAMAKCGADAPEFLSQILLRMFVPIFPLRHLVVVWDAWLCEGSKVIFRYGLALLKMYKKRLKALKLKEGQGAQWWAKLREWTHDPNFPFHELSTKAFHLRTKSGLRPVTSAMLEHYHDKNEAEVKAGGNRGGSRYDETGAAHDRADEQQPFFWPPFQLTATFPPPALLSDLASRSKLVKWVPEILRHKRLRVVFTTEIHGYNLDLLFSHCRTVSPSLLVVEANNGTIFGGFCSEPWMYPNRQPFGSGQCFLFRLSPNSATYRWKADAANDVIKNYAAKQEKTGFHLPSVSRHNSKPSGGGGGLLSALSVHSSSKLAKMDSAGDIVPSGSKHGAAVTLTGSSAMNASKHGGSMSASRHRGSLLPRAESLNVGSMHRRAQAANESFMVTTKEYIAMGVSPNGGCGLKLYEDLTRGTSDVCETYGNEPLVNASNHEFVVTCVEVYAFE